MLNFLESKFSGYLAIIQLGLIVAAVLSIYFYGYGECVENQLINDGEAAQRQVQIESEIATDLRNKNKEVMQDESSDLNIIRNAINRL